MRNFHLPSPLFVKVDWRGRVEKKRNFHLHSPLSVKVDWRGREMMNSSGLECEVCVVHFKWINGERGWT